MVHLIDMGGGGGLRLGFLTVITAGLGFSECFTTTFMCTHHSLLAKEGGGGGGERGYNLNFLKK